MRFWKEKSVENAVTLAGLPLTLGPREEATLVETDQDSYYQNWN